MKRRNIGLLPILKPVGFGQRRALRRDQIRKEAGPFLLGSRNGRSKPAIRAERPDNLHDMVPQ